MRERSRRVAAGHDFKMDGRISPGDEASIRDCERSRATHGPAGRDACTMEALAG